MSRRSIFILATIIGTIALDQITKVWVRANVELYTEKRPIIGEYFTLMNVENKGAFLGMGSELNTTLRIILLMILPVVVLGFVLRYVFKDKNLDNWSLFAFSAIIGGGVANVFDRIVFKKVTDFWFIDLGDPFKTGVFNVADVFVTTGMIILVFTILLKKKPKNIEKAD